MSTPQGHDADRTRRRALIAAAIIVALFPLGIWWSSYRMDQRTEGLAEAQQLIDQHGRSQPSTAAEVVMKLCNGPNAKDVPTGIAWVRVMTGMDGYPADLTARVLIDKVCEP